MQLGKHSLGFLLLGVVCQFVADFPSQAQDPELAFEQVVGHPRGLPQLPPQGAWGEVINVTSRWLVIQNHSGQQYPIATDDIGEFLVRWPSSVENLGPQAWSKPSAATWVPTWSRSSMSTSSREPIELSSQPTYNSLAAQ